MIWTAIIGCQYLGIWRATERIIAWHSDCPYSLILACAVVELDANTHVEVLEVAIVNSEGTPRSVIAILDPLVRKDSEKLDKGYNILVDKR